QLHVLPWHAFVIECIISQQHLAAELRFSRVVLNRRKLRKNFLANLASECLALVDVLLAESFGAMAENFVKENGGGAPRHDRGAGIGLPGGAFFRGSRFLTHA